MTQIQSHPVERWTAPCCALYKRVGRLFTRRRQQVRSPHRACDRPWRRRAAAFFVCPGAGGVHAGGVILVSYVYGNDLISQNRGGERSFYHVDGLGSTRALTNSSGVVTDRYVYDAFGRTIGQVGTTGNVYLFAGEQRDANVGLDYLRARYLSVGTGRFMSPDSFPGLM